MPEQAGRQFGLPLGWTKQCAAHLNAELPHVGAHRIRCGHIDLTQFLALVDQLTDGVV